ncbi:MAG: COP23 domain-containing protein [Pleurocapsa sp. MO_226.B13]|nr:COP23 domain-containing protein [Pleurocapsa sp. MO_226.B13]
MKLPTQNNQSSLRARFSASLAIASCLLGLTAFNSVQAQTEKGFKCDTDSGVPTTIYNNARGVKEPWIKWVSDYFSNSDWTPLSRCKTVSQRLEEYRRQGKLKYVTLGTQNEQQIICVASYDNGPCEGIIYTLKPGQDGIAALNNLFAWGSGQEDLEASYETYNIPYINVEERLDEQSSN